MGMDEYTKSEGLQEAGEGRKSEGLQEAVEGRKSQGLQEAGEKMNTWGDRKMNQGSDKRAYYITAADLSAAGKENIPDQLVSGRHLIYSSPATLAFNSPGAQGFGVKRAGLSIPGSVMLVVSPGCCARNTTIISRIKGYSDRFFYLLLDSTDIVTGRHLKRIPEAARALYNGLEEKPGVIMICITCVDALLGTDMERVCRKASDAVGIPVLPCYMYALTREGRKPPMVFVRESIYSLLKKADKRSSTTVNILGHFAPLSDDCELYDLLKGFGIRKINEISRLKSFDEYLDMSKANFNLVLDQEAVPAAQSLMKRAGIPYIEIKRFYRMEKIEKQYRLLAASLGASVCGQVETERENALERLENFKIKYGSLRFAIGNECNANPFELALALLEYGFRVEEIFADPSGEDFIYLDKIAQVSPGTRIYSNLEPTMIYYENNKVPVDICIGKDAVYYHHEAACLGWSQDIQPFGYSGLRRFFEACQFVIEEKAARERIAEEKAIAEKNDEEKIIEEEKMKKALCGEIDACSGDENASFYEDTVKVIEPTDIKGLRLKIAPFAPDQSGAAAVFCQLGGNTVIVDAGGCAGNICGFDEPRWFSSKSAIFSAGLREMDAVLGRDDKLLEKICKAQKDIDTEFTALIGTPVPAVIATDYKALSRIIEKKTGKKVVYTECDGTRNYDLGASEAFVKLFETFAGQGPEKEPLAEKMKDRDLAEEKRFAESLKDGKLQEEKRFAESLKDGDLQEEKRFAESLKDGELMAGNRPAKCPENEENEAEDGFVGILGATPMDLGDIDLDRQIAPYLERKKIKKAFPYTMGAGLDCVRKAGQARKNIVLAPCGLAAARFLEKKYGTPFEIDYPLELLDNLNLILKEAHEHDVKKILIIHQQFLANALRERIFQEEAKENSIIINEEEAKENSLILNKEEATENVSFNFSENSDREPLKIDVASWFMMEELYAGREDISLASEGDFIRLVRGGGYDLIIGDGCFRKAIGDYKGRYIELPHFAVSGKV